MKNFEKIWIVEAHNLGALQVRAVGDALALNRKHWLAGEKSDRLLVGMGETIEEALEVERELKRMRREKPGDKEVVGEVLSEETDKKSKQEAR